MVTFSCPWCEEDAALTLSELAEPETSFTCPKCGTTVSIVDDAAVPLELAA